MKEALFAKIMDESLYESFVCNLCLEPYTEPKSLPCLHCFCRECLLRYLESRQPETASVSSVLRYDSFPCPVCKKRVKLQWQQRLSVGSLGAVIDSTFPDNFHVVSLMQQLEIRPLTKYCGMCIRDDIKERSTIWCQDCNQALCQKCADTHRLLRMTSKHQLCLSGGMRSFILGNSGYPCSKHEDEPLKSFCMNCQICICYKCHMTDHKICSNILLLEDAVVEYSSEAKIIIEDIRSQMESMVLLRDKISRQRNSSQENRIKVVSEIQKMTARLVEALQNNETELLEELDNFHHEEDHKMETLENEVNNLLSTLSETYRIFDNSFQGKNQPQFLNLVTTIRKEMPKNDREVENLNLQMNQKKRTFRFDMNTKIHECLKLLEGLPLGTVTIATDTFSEVGSNGESIVTYSLPKVESSTSMDSVKTVDSATEMTITEKPMLKRRSLLSWFCRRAPTRVQQLTSSVSRGEKESLIPDGVIFLSSDDGNITWPIKPSDSSEKDDQKH